MKHYEVWVREDADPHQDVLQLDVAMQETLTVQKANTLHHIQSDQKTLLQGQTRLRERQIIINDLLYIHSQVHNDSCQI